MGRFVWPLTAVFVVLIALSVGAVGLAWAEQRVAETPARSSLEGLSNRRLLEVFDEASASDPDRAMQIAQTLWQRRKRIPRRDILSAITDRSRPQVSRELMVDLLAGLPEEARITDEVRCLLRDGRINPQLKARLITRYRFDVTDSRLLASLASSSEEPVAFHALKKLSQADPSTALHLAKVTLSRTDHPSDLKLSAAYKVLIRSGTLESDSAMRHDSLRHLASVLADERTSPRLRDSATFALAGMRSLDALRILLGSTSVDRQLVAGAIDENATVIKSALEQNPTESTIELAITAMELHPIRDVAEPLRAAKSIVQSPSLAHRLDAVLARIRRDGVSANPRWTEN